MKLRIFVFSFVLPLSLLTCPARAAVVVETVVDSCEIPRLQVSLDDRYVLEQVYRIPWYSIGSVANTRHRWENGYDLWLYSDPNVPDYRQYAGGCEVIRDMYSTGDDRSSLQKFLDEIYGKMREYARTKKNDSTIRYKREAAVTGRRASMDDLSSWAVTTASPGYFGGHITVPNSGFVYVVFQALQINDPTGELLFLVGEESDGIQADELSQVAANYALGDLTIGTDYIVELQGTPGEELYIEYLILSDVSDNVIVISDPLEETPEPAPGC